MSIRSPKQSRFERRSLARQRRVQKRLEQLQRGAPRRRNLSKSGRSVLFAASLLLGLGLARVVTATVVSWWSEEPKGLRSVAVQGTQRLTSAAVAASIAEARGTPADAVDAERIEEAVVAHPWIRAARVALLPTGTVIVDVEERVPRAVLRVGEDDDGPAYFVDGFGVAFAPVEPPFAHEAHGLPVLVAAQPDAAPDLDEVLLLLDRLDGLSLPGLATGDAPHRGLRLHLPPEGDERGFVLARSDGRTEVVLGAPASAVLERLDRLERLLLAGLGELRMTTSIDLRFAGQAVLRTEGASS